MKDYKTNDRIEYLDYFRSCGIILMVMGHIGYGEIFDKFIHAFNMPMFFFLSGFLYNRTDVDMGQILIYKSKKLLIPYFIMGLFHCLLYGVLYGFSLDHYYHLFLFNNDGIPIAGALWFLTALFFTDIFYLYLDRNHLNVLIIPISLLGCVLDSYFHIQLPWSLNASFVGLGLYYLGDLFKRIKNTAPYNMIFQKGWIVVVAILSMYLIFENGYINMRTGRYSNIFLFWINAVLSICILLSLSEVVSKKHHIEWLLGIGKNSIVYLCLNQLVITITKRILAKIPIPLYVNRWIVFIISMSVLYFVVRIVSESKLKVIFGLK